MNWNTGKKNHLKVYAQGECHQAVMFEKQEYLKALKLNKIISAIPFKNRRQCFQGKEDQIRPKSVNSSPGSAKHLLSGLGWLTYHVWASISSSVRRKGR